jgi:hypothetical protein
VVGSEFKPQYHTHTHTHTHTQTRQQGPKRMALEITLHTPYMWVSPSASQKPNILAHILQLFARLPHRPAGRW